MGGGGQKVCVYANIWLNICWVISFGLSVQKEKNTNNIDQVQKRAYSSSSFSKKSWFSNRSPFSDWTDAEGDAWPSDAYACHKYDAEQPFEQRAGAIAKKKPRLIPV